MKDSPVKKLDFNLEDKENMPVTLESTPKFEPKLGKKLIPEVKEATAQPKAPKTLKELEAEEPLLQENPHRFVLFPIKYHEIVSTQALATPVHDHLHCPNTQNPVEYVQESRGIILDGGRSGLIQRSSRLAQSSER